MSDIFSTLLSVAYTFASLCAVVYLSIPVLVKFLPSIVVQGTFLNLMCSPKRFSCLNQPKKAWKLDGVQHHYVKSKDGKLGVWHIIPATNDDPELEAGLSLAKKIIIYCHGNAWHRSFGHRRSLYSLLRKNGFHVVTFDYRGYGDSDGWPSEKGVIDDTLVVYKWVIGQVSQPECKVFVWGHSLGTAIATQAVYQIELGDYIKPSGVILEAPFTSAVDAMTEYPLSKNLAKCYPGDWMKKIFINALAVTQIRFPTVKILPKLNSNVLILHAQDDKKVHFRLGKKLFDETKNNTESSLNLVFVAFKACHGLGHNGIWQHPDLPSLVDTLSQGLYTNRFTEIEL